MVDDDPKVRTLLRHVLESDGNNVREAVNAQETLRTLADWHVDLVTLDVSLGADNGLDLARRIRATSDLPIIMVTGKDDVIDRVVGLEIGTDDYITKPFHVREVVARVNAVLRRTARADAPHPQIGQESASGPAYRFDGLTAVPDLFQLTDRSGDLIDLTSSDFRLLVVFLENAKRVLSRDRLMDLTTRTEWNPLDRAIDNQVARLRKKIEITPSRPALIKTVRGIGYTLACDVTKG